MVTNPIAICPSCKHTMPQGICGVCAVPTATESNARKLIDNPLVVLSVLFGMTGGFGLPLLWMSRGFRGWHKVVLTVVVVFYTALILWLIWILLGYIAGQWGEIKRAFR